jgi:hypothetical protein
MTKYWLKILAKVMIHVIMSFVGLSLESVEIVAVGALLPCLEISFVMKSAMLKLVDSTMEIVDVVLAAL